MTECNKQFNIFETFLDLFVICINIKNKENIQTDNLKQCYIYIYIIIIYMWKKTSISVSFSFFKFNVK